MLSLLATFVILFSGCKQDVDLTSDYKETPIVYGLLNSQQTTHYIRIQKGYLIDGNAYTAAGIPDSIYYSDSLSVKLIAYSGGNVSGQPLVFTKVVNEQPKDSGVFANNPNVLYKYTGAIDQNKTYKLQIVNTVSNDTFGSLEAGGIGLVKNFQVITPIEDLITGDNFIGLSSASPYSIKWRPAENGAVYDIVFRFPYLEFNESDNSLVADTFVEVYILRSGPGVTENNVLSAVFNPLSLLNTLKQNLEVRNDRYRVFNTATGITLHFTAGGTTLARYINAQNAQGSGLSSNEALPPYTNIDGGYGIFSSRYTKIVDDIKLSNAGLDTLSCSPITAPLRFRGSNGQVCF